MYRDSDIGQKIDLFEAEIEFFLLLTFFNDKISGSNNR